MDNCTAIRYRKGTGTAHRFPKQLIETIKCRNDAFGTIARLQVPDSFRRSNPVARSILAYLILIPRILHWFCGISIWMPQRLCLDDVI